MIEDRFIIAPKSYTLNCSVNFAECHRKQERSPENGITATLDFYSAPQKVAETSAEPVPKSAESEQESNTQPTVSSQENSESAAEGASTIDMPVSAENSEKPQENTQSKPSISNFANAHIF